MLSWVYTYRENTLVVSGDEGMVYVADAVVNGEAEPLGTAVVDFGNPGNGDLHGVGRRLGENRRGRVRAFGVVAEEENGIVEPVSVKRRSGRDETLHVNADKLLVGVVAALGVADGELGTGEMVKGLEGLAAAGVGRRREMLAHQGNGADAEDEDQGQQENENFAGTEFARCHSAICSG